MGIAATPVMTHPESGARVVSVFVSHKHEDSSTARQIKRWFENLGGGRLEVHISELIPLGEQWDAQIRKWLKEADWLLLLYTGPGDWHWCLYEMGFFAGAHEPAQRLVCVHPEGIALPEQLRGWQATTDRQFENLMAQIFRNELFPGAKPINTQMNDADLKEVAQKIMEGFTDRGRPLELTPHIELKLDPRHKQALCATRRLAGDIAVSADAKARDIFGLIESTGDQPLSWSDIQAQLELSQQTGWIPCLADSLRRLCQRQAVIFTTLPAVYSVAGEQPRRWRPILHSAQIGGAKEEFQLIFSEILPEDDPRPSDTRLDYCMTLMKMCRMVRFGIIEPYTRKLKRFQRQKSLGMAVSQQEMEESLGSLPSAIDRIETEGMHSSLSTQDSARRALFCDELSQLMKWTREWIECRTKVVSAVETGNLDVLEEALGGMQVVNRECLRLIAHKYCDMLDQLK